MTGKDEITVDVEQARKIAELQAKMENQEPATHGVVNCGWVCGIGIGGWLPLWMYLDHMNDNCDDRLELFFILAFVSLVVGATVRCLIQHVIRADFDAGAPKYPTAMKVSAARRLPSSWTDAHAKNVVRAQVLTKVFMLVMVAQLAFGIWGVTLGTRDTELRTARVSESRPLRGRPRRHGSRERRMPSGRYVPLRFRYRYPHSVRLRMLHGNHACHGRWRAWWR